MKNLRIDSAVKLKLSGTAQDVDIVASLIDKTKLIVSDDGTVTGLDEQINPLKHLSLSYLKMLNYKKIKIMNRLAETAAIL